MIPMEWFPMERYNLISRHSLKVLLQNQVRNVLKLPSHSKRPNNMGFASAKAPLKLDESDMADQASEHFRSPMIRGMGSRAKTWTTKSSVNLLHIPGLTICG
ncbi:hypothetical protein M758_3G093700 [Ceratodon purpureus]|nr:hypothetical protein M758_3G093700 [Ceratodon purpureus]